MKEKNYITFKCLELLPAEKNEDEENAIALIDIAGYPSTDEDETGEIVCRVWLLKIPNEKGKAQYLVDWHRNEYCFNQSVKNLIMFAKDELQHYLESVADDLILIAHERHKLKWMLDHGYTLEDLIKILGENSYDGRIDCNALDKTYNEFQTIVGFTGTIWPNAAEFRDNEAHDETIMRELLTDKEYLLWQVAGKNF